MRALTLQLRGNKLIPIIAENVKPTTNSINQFTAKVDVIGDNWDGLTLYATFNGTPQLVVDGEVTFPQEAVTSVGLIELGISGLLTDGTTYSSETVNIPCIKGSLLGNEAELPTQTVWEQYLAIMQAYVNEVKDIQIESVTSITVNDKTYEAENGNIDLGTISGGTTQNGTVRLYTLGLEDYKGSLYELANELADFVSDGTIKVGSYVSGGVQLSDMPSGLINAEITITIVYDYLMLAELWSTTNVPYRWFAWAFTSDDEDAVWHTYDENAPTKTSQLTNDSGFITNAVANLTNYYLKSETYTKTEVTSLINAITSVSFLVVDELPTVGVSNIIYLVPNVISAVDNVKDEYIWVGDSWELIGSTAVDLSNYVDKTSYQTISGIKNFTATPTINDVDIATETYVDNEIQSVLGDIQTALVAINGEES